MDNHPTPLITMPLGISVGWMLGQLTYGLIDPTYQPSVTQFVLPFMFTCVAFFFYMKIDD